MNQLTENQAVDLAKSGAWKNWSSEEVVKFQLYQERLCMDFSVFRKAVEEVLGRTVWTHEFAYADALREEYEGLRPAPTFEEIIGMIPEEKQILAVIEGEL